MINSLSADDVNCTSSVGELKGTASFHGFHERFAQMLSKLTLVDAFGNDEKAVILYGVCQDSCRKFNSTFIDCRVANDPRASYELESPGL